MTDDLKIPEILAPAGGREQFFAALNAGADAVFLGLKSFNARARAENFTTDDLLELVPLAHHYGMKVLVTVNVLIKQTELPQLIDLLADLEAAKVDAIIVQDLGVARLARACFPGLRLHASTQMAVHNLAGVRKAQSLGFRRVVLAREMTAVELRKIRSAIPCEEVEIEAFCHGSLCYSYSGLCFFSGAEDARSGNRGECAYTCRQPYDIVNEEKSGFLFSMRDLDTSKDLDQLVRAGIDTLKIEGRKKDAQYVASTVRLYRAKLDEIFGRSTLRPEAPRPKSSAIATQGNPGGDKCLSPSDSLASIEQDLALTFQRQPTSFFLKGRYHENVIDLDNPGHLGIEIGRVTRSTGRVFKVRLSGAIERFDGIRIFSPDQINRQRRYDNDLLEFSLRDMTLRGKRVFEAPSGAEVEISLPPEKPAPKVGDIVYKTRSADLKRRIGQLSTPPENAKLRALKSISLAFEASCKDESLTLIAHAIINDEWLSSAEIGLPATKSKGPSTLLDDLHGTFNVMGKSGFFTDKITFSGEEDWFVPRSLIKKFRDNLEDQLPGSFENWMSDRKKRAHAFLTSSIHESDFTTPTHFGFVKISHPEPATVSPDAKLGFQDSRLCAQNVDASPRDEISYAVKVDRLDTFKDVIAYHQDYPHFSLREIVFEPKRAFLPDLDPKGLAQMLVNLSAASGLSLRIALPTVIRAWDEPLLGRWIKTLFAEGVRRFEIGNIGAFELLRSWGIDLSQIDLSGDFTLYALNSCSSRAWMDMGLDRITLSIEDDYKNLTAHLGNLTSSEKTRLSAILFKDTPLFIAEACSLTALHGGCPTSEVCGYRTLTIKNPRGDTFYVAHESCKSIVYGQEPYSIVHAQKALSQLGVKHFRCDFLTRAYDKEGIFAVLDALKEDIKLADTHSANWERSLL